MAGKFQSTVRRDMAAGLIGELAFDGPLRVTPGLVADGVTATIGHFYVKDPATGRYEFGAIDEAGTLVFGGILMSPKEQASYGTQAGGPLDATLVVPEGQVCSFLEMGMLWLIAPATTPVQEGMILQYTLATGAITPVAAGTTPPGTAGIIPNAVVHRVPNQSMTAGTVYAVKLTN